MNCQRVRVHERAAAIVIGGDPADLVINLKSAKASA